jgi:hypothetical protein
MPRAAFRRRFNEELIHERQKTKCYLTTLFERSAQCREE